MPNRKFHIRCDMEGVSGVVSMAQVTPHAPEYALAREWFMAELMALVEGLRAGGATEVSIYDEHWFGRNVDLARIPKDVRVFCGKPPYRPNWAAGVDSSCTGLILHGLHSMEGTGFTLCHTYEPDFRAINLNGTPVGEIGVEAAVAGDWGVPLAMVIADSAGCAEAKALVPGVETVATKISHSYSGAECFPLCDVVKAIRQKAIAIAKRKPATRPYKLEAPVELACSFKPGRYLDGLRRLAKNRFTTVDTIKITADTVTAAWAEYWQLKLKVQSALG